MKCYNTMVNIESHNEILKESQIDGKEIEFH